jgi:hypothetical protein
MASLQQSCRPLGASSTSRPARRFAAFGPLPAAHRASIRPSLLVARAEPESKTQQQVVQVRARWPARPPALGAPRPGLLLPASCPAGWARTRRLLAPTGPRLLLLPPRAGEGGPAALGAPRERAQDAGGAGQEGPALAAVPGAVDAGGHRVGARHRPAAAAAGRAPAHLRACSGAGGARAALAAAHAPASAGQPALPPASPLAARRASPSPLPPQVGSIFEYVDKNPVFGVLQPDNPLWAPVLLFMGVTGLPTAGFLFYKGVQGANEAAELQDKMDGYID